MSEKRSATSDDFSPELYRVARRLVWWRPPEEALHDRIRFAAQVMNLGTWRDIQTLSRSWGEGVFANVGNACPFGQAIPSVMLVTGG